MPGLVKKFISRASIEAQYVFVILTCGAHVGGAPSRILEDMKKNGITVSYFRKIEMVDNYLPMFDIEDEIKNQHKKQSETKIASAVAEISEELHSLPVLPFYKKPASAIAQFFYKRRLATAYQKFTIEESCNLCSVCQKVCPVNNIEVKEEVVIGKNCTECFACTHNCPQNAIRIKGEKSRARYRHPDVSLKEIVKVNNV